MFNKEFYPTPRHVLDRMGIDCYDKIVIEPSAGKGDIIDYCKGFGAKKILACEINTDLQKIVASKADLICDDFFKVTPEQISHVGLIVMNPPFSNAAKHILHAWQVAPEGCEIVALCNWETLDNRYSYSRTELGQLVENYGSKENLEDCFTEAERKTDAKIGLIHLFKPIVSSNFNYSGFYFTDDEGQGQNGVMPYNDVRAIVNSYVAAVNNFDTLDASMQAMNALTNNLGFGRPAKLDLKDSQTDSSITKQAFAKQLQKHCWKKVFNKLGVEKVVTTGVLKDINKFVEHRLAYPFTMRNIFRMIEIIIGTREQTMNKAIIEAVDNFTRHTHENRFGVEGWKTNEGHLLNSKFICDGIAKIGYNGLLEVRTYYSHQVDYLIDLMKALCFITGIDFDSIPNPYQLPKFKSNTWYEWGFFEFKLFKKGTGHFKFKDLKVWEVLNRSYAKAKGQVLPEKFKNAD